MQDKDLDQLLAQAARDRPTPSPGLMARVLADAMAEQPTPRRTVAVPGPARPGLMARLAGAFGGAPVLAGLCSAAIAGGAMGYLNPGALDMVLGGSGGAETIELFPSADFLTTEG